MSATQLAFWSGLTIGILLGWLVLGVMLAVKLPRRRGLRP